MSGAPTDRYGTPTHAMLLIKSLDPNASLMLSEWTHQWYVSARIDISDGCMLTSGGNHHDTPEQAIYGYMDWLTNVPIGQVLVTKAHYSERRHYRWNGAAFAEEPMPTPAHSAQDRGGDVAR